ncbi:MAG TPA: hypothetical protein VH349_12175 [Ktedonobacterales bacterium]|jgi:rubredoxin
MSVDGDETRYMCPVCGFAALEEPPYKENGYPVPVGPHGEPLKVEMGYPTHLICPSCGFHFGYDDELQLIDVPDDQILIELDHIFRRWREEWIAGGMKFWSGDWRRFRQSGTPIA